MSLWPSTTMERRWVCSASGYAAEPGSAEWNGDYTRLALFAFALLAAGALRLQLPR
jgi:hypothetical protein